MADLTGHLLKGRYRVETLLGRGGMAEVYKAWDTWRNYYVAVKVMREDLAEDVEFVRRFRREAAALARLAHENIVRFYAFEQDDLTAFIVMDYVEGATLRTEIARAGGPMQLERGLAITRDVCAALNYAHLEGVIHRDIKPANIMLRPDGRALLSDFGISKAADTATATATMVSVGTPAYMSPEQCLGQPPDARTDIYSLGVVVYEMLAGRRPFVGEAAPDTITATSERIRWEQTHAAPPPLRKLNPAIPREVEAVVMAALAKHRDQRWPTAAAFADALVRAFGQRMDADPRMGATTAGVLPVEKQATPSMHALPRAGVEGPRPMARSTDLRGVPWAIWAAIGGVLVVLLVLLAYMGGQMAGGSPVTPPALAEVPTNSPAAPAVPTRVPTFISTRTGVGIPTPTETPSPQPIPTATPTSTPAPSPTSTATRVILTSSQQIAFASMRDGAYEIFVMAADGTDQRRLTQSPDHDECPQWSPDGRLIAFYSHRDGNFEVYVMNPDGTNQRNLTRHPADDGSPAWSPDGRQIAFDSNRDGNSEIYVMNADGTDQRNLTKAPSSEHKPSWSPDGRQIAFISNRDGNPEIYVMNVDGSNQRNLTRNPSSDECPVWAHGGDRIAFYTNRDGNWEVYAMGTDGSNQRNLTRHPKDDGSPTWSPDDSLIAFDSNRDGNYEIYAMNADGTDLRNLTKTPTDEYKPSWQSR